jgi:hypothetical protein
MKFRRSAASFGERKHGARANLYSAETSRKYWNHIDRRKDIWSGSYNPVAAGAKLKVAVCGGARHEQANCKNLGDICHSIMPIYRFSERKSANRRHIWAIAH